MPAPYFYSDISTGLLVLGSDLGSPMGDGAVDEWLDLVARAHPDSLGTADTFLFVPGFSSEVRLVPNLDLGVVVLANANLLANESTGKKPCRRPPSPPTISCARSRARSSADAFSFAPEDDWRRAADARPVVHSFR